MAVSGGLAPEDGGDGPEGVGGVDHAGGVVGGVDHHALGTGADGGLEGGQVGLEGGVVRGDHHRLAAVAGDEVGIFGEEGGEEDELVAGAGQGPEAAAQSCRRPHRQVQVAGPVAPAEAAGQGVRQGLPDGPIALGGGIAVDGGPLGRVQDGPDGVVHLGRRGHGGIAQREIQHVLRPDLPGAEQSIFPDFPHDVSFGAHLHQVLRQIAHCCDLRVLKRLTTL